MFGLDGESSDEHNHEEDVEQGENMVSGTKVATFLQG